MVRVKLRWLLVAVVFLGLAPAHAAVLREWLTHRTHDPRKLTVNWQTDAPGDSMVLFGDTPELGKSRRVAERTTLHQVDIPFGEGDTPLYYAVQTSGQRSVMAAVNRYGGAELRAAVVADWQGDPDLAALLHDEPHILFVAGDQLTSLYETCGVGVKDCVTPFAALVDKYPELFRSVPVMPALGNHDRQVRPRGAEPPAEAVYDIDATAWRSFYPLPGDGWKWRFDIPAFDVRFIALDLSHTTDQGTTWQTGHPFARGSEQFEWYAKQMARRDRAFVITLQNEQNSLMRSYEGNEWHRMFSEGSAVISGFGLFAERAEVDGFPYFNTGLVGGTPYPDFDSKFLVSEPSYALLRFRRGEDTFTVELKSLTGMVLDQSEWPALPKQ